MVIAVELCDTIHVYGMVPPNYCRYGAPHHPPTLSPPHKPQKPQILIPGGLSPLSARSRRPQPRRMAYHYYEPKGPDECTTYIHNERSRRGNHHRFITEKRVFASWAGLYNITFSHPAWP